MDYKELFYKMVIALITAFIAALPATGIEVTKSVIIAACVAGIAAAWNIFLQFYSPAQIIGKATSSGKSVNWATKLRKY